MKMISVVFQLCILLLVVAEVFAFQASALDHIRRAAARPCPSSVTAVNGIPEDTSTAAVVAVLPNDALSPLNGESSKEQGSFQNEAPDVQERTIFDLVACRSAVCLYQSDIRRDAIGKAAGIQASSATNWINDASAFALQKSLDRLKLKLPEDRTGLDRDYAASWLRWWKAMPCPAIVNLSTELQSTINETLSDASLVHIDQSRQDFLSRIGCRVILLPSGTRLASPLLEPAASIIYGKLLYGGVTRYRLLGAHNSQKSGQQPRRAGVRTEVKPVAADNVPSWMMYGGPDRMYEGVDMGAAAVLEVILLPRGKTLESSVSVGRSMVVNGMVWKPQNMFDIYDGITVQVNGDVAQDDKGIKGYTPASLSGRDRNEAFRADFRSAVGGLQPQIDAIVRRVLDGRVIRPADEDGAATSAAASTALEAEELDLLGLSPVRGLLLYGPPGCGTWSFCVWAALESQPSSPLVPLSSANTSVYRNRQNSIGP
jgi:hypothetical protein